MSLSNHIVLWDAAIATDATQYTPGSKNPGTLGKGYEVLEPCTTNFCMTLEGTWSAGTLDVTLQHSPNAGTDWFDVVSFTQVTSTSTDAQFKAVLSDTTPDLLPYVRAKMVSATSAALAGVKVKLWFENVRG